MNVINLNGYVDDYTIEGKNDRGEYILRPNHDALRDWADTLKVEYPAYFVGNIVVNGRNRILEPVLAFDRFRYFTEPTDEYYGRLDENELAEEVDDLRELLDMNRMDEKVAAKMEEAAKEAAENEELSFRQPDIESAIKVRLGEKHDWLIPANNKRPYTLRKSGENIILSNAVSDMTYGQPSEIINERLFNEADNVASELKPIAKRFGYNFEYDYPTGKDGVVEFAFMKDSKTIIDSVNTNIIDRVMSEFGFVKNIDYSIQELDGGLFDIVSNTDLTTGSDELPLKDTKWHYPEQSAEIMSQLKEVFAKNRIAAKMTSEWGVQAVDGSRVFIKIIFNRIVNEK